MIAFRLLSIAVRRYSTEPASRESAAQMLLLNALRLCVYHVGRKDTAKLVLDAIDGDLISEDRACS